MKDLCTLYSDEIVLLLRLLVLNSKEMDMK
jgi:hypothetical protein